MEKSEIIELLSTKSENENLEFKELKNTVSIMGNKGKQRNCLLAYIVAIANEGGGKLILGVRNAINSKTNIRDIVGTSAIPDIQQAKSAIYDYLKCRIDIKEYIIDKKRIVIINIPSRPVGIVYEFYGIPLMRIGERLEKMDQKTFVSILMEGSPDFSSEICRDITTKDLDKNALKLLKKLWVQKSQNQEYLKYSTDKILQKLLLSNQKGLTNACVLLLGKEDVISSLLPQSEIILENRIEPKKIDFDFKKIWRKPFLLAVDEVWDVINARNTRTPFKQGFIETDIWSYDKNSIREALLNAFAHREYRNKVEPIFIKLSPKEFTIKSPGGFLPGVNPQNALYVEGKWRNRLLMEVLHEIGFVERSGVGLDRVFETSIKSGKGSPLLEETTDDFVKLTLPAIIQDIGFVSYLEKLSSEKNIMFNEIDDLVEIENIRSTGKYKEKPKAEKFLKMGIIERIGIGSGTRYVLSKKFYEHIGKKAEYTRRKGLNRESRLELLRNYFNDNQTGQMADLRELFDYNLDRKQIQKLLNILRYEGLIYFDPTPSPQKGYWKISKEGGKLGASWGQAVISCQSNTIPTIKAYGICSIR